MVALQYEPSSLHLEVFRQVAPWIWWWSWSIFRCGFSGGCLTFFVYMSKYAKRKMNTGIQNCNYYERSDIIIFKSANFGFWSKQMYQTKNPQIRTSEIWKLSTLLGHWASYPLLMFWHTTKISRRPGCFSSTAIKHSPSNQRTNCDQRSFPRLTKGSRSHAFKASSSLTMSLGSKAWRLQTKIEIHQPSWESKGPPTP